MKLFGTDGVRGVANGVLTPETAYRLGRVLAWRMREAGTERNPERALVLLGKDTRLSGDLLEASLAAGIMSSGGDVEMVGIVPTPAVAHLVTAGGSRAGVMVSASHNPVEDNGIKCFSGDGYKLPDELEAEMEKAVGELAQGRDRLPRPQGDRVGRLRSVEVEARRIYLEHLEASVPRKLGRNRGRRLKVVLDCAHGSACLVAPRLLEELGAEVEVIHGEPDGSRINVDCGSTALSDLQKAVLEKEADLGLAFDGDADRCLAVDEGGRVVNGDSLLAVFGRFLLHGGKLAGKTVVTTVMSNLGLRVFLEGLGIRVEVTAVGDRHVLAALRAGGYNLGGEQSGHLIFRDYATTGDGLLTAIQLCRVVVETQTPLGELHTGWSRLPQVLLNVVVGDRTALQGNRRIEDAVKVAQAELGSEGRVLLRPSGTEPLIRVMVEGREEKNIRRIADRLADTVMTELG